MINHTTSELTGHALSLAVAMALGLRLEQFSGGKAWVDDGAHVSNESDWMPWMDWAQGGPIIEQHKIDVCCEPTIPRWVAFIANDESDARTLRVEYGETPLIAAMRCLVASELGAVVALEVD